MDREPSLELNDVSQPCYEALGLSVTASEGEIKHAYKRLAKEWHPDKHKGDPNAKEIFQQVVRAYRILTDPAARELHDLQFQLLDQLNIHQFLKRYWFFVFSPQGLSLAVSDHDPPISAAPLAHLPAAAYVIC